MLLIGTQHLIYKIMINFKFLYNFASSMLAILCLEYVLNDSLLSEISKEKKKNSSFERLKVFLD